MTQLARKGQSIEGHYHLEYSYVEHLIQRRGGCAVTILRDPVERFMSEFSMARGEKGSYLTQDQWDFHDKDLKWLETVENARTSPNETAALLEYLRSPNNPTRNRQALYLLGFDRVRCDRTCCGICDDQKRGYPAHAYDWDKDHDKLLSRAKEHLRSMTSFGVADCYVDSVRAMANSVGWDAEGAANLANTIHERKQDKRPTLAALLSTHSSPAARRHVALLSQGVGTSLWSAGMDEWLHSEILSVNRLDAELVDYAKQLFYEQHGVRCAHKAK